MVDITPQEVMEMRKSEKALEDMSPREREIVGGTVRLDLPFFTRRDIMRLEGRQLKYPRVRKSRIFGKMVDEN
jgi:hypothetical protein